MPRLIKLCMPFLVCLAIFSAGIALGASKVTSSKFRLDGKPLAVTSSIHAGATATELGVDSDTNSSKHAYVHRWSINSQEVDVLVRVQEANGGIWIDMIADATVSSLSTTAAAISLTGIGHPSPSKDAVDTQALVAAGGS